MLKHGFLFVLSVVSRLGMAPNVDEIVNYHEMVCNQAFQGIALPSQSWVEGKGGVRVPVAGANVKCQFLVRTSVLCFVHVFTNDISICLHVSRGTGQQQDDIIIVFNLNQDLNNKIHSFKAPTQCLWACKSSKTTKRDAHCLQ